MNACRVSEELPFVVQGVFLSKLIPFDSLLGTTLGGADNRQIWSSKRQVGILQSPALGRKLFQDAMWGRQLCSKLIILSARHALLAFTTFMLRASFFQKDSPHQLLYHLCKFLGLPVLISS